MSALVLMYHAVPASLSRCIAADPYYAVEMQRFVEHLMLMRDEGLEACSVRDLRARAGGAGLPRRAVALTFDDGHESNFAAFAEIRRLGGSADLFINPGMVGKPGYLSWAQLRELDRYGASIQSHGQLHRSLDELSPAEIDEELQVSRRQIEDELDKPAELFAPPNGRTVPGLAQRVQHLGYKAMCSSRVGLWKDPRATEIPRWAVRAATPTRSLQAWLTRSPWALGLATTRAAALTAGKRVLGRSAYRKLRESVLGAGKDA